MKKKFSKEVLNAYFGNNYNCLIENAIIWTCITKAYADATMQGAFVYHGDAILLKEAKEKSEKYIYTFVNKLDCNSVMNKDKFDKLHSKILETVVGYFLENNISNFTFGNAQKWLNMTLKYYYLLGQLDESWNAVLHMPVDSSILKVLCKEIEKNGNIVLPGQDGTAVSNKYSKGSKGRKDIWDLNDPFDNRLKRWSKWDCEDYYTVFRSGIDKCHNKYSLEWEIKEWIKNNQ